MFAGIGGLDLAVADAMGAHARLQIDQVGEEVRSARFGCSQLVGDVRALSLSNLGACDVLAAGFPCKDLSRIRHHGQGLRGEHSGLYAHVLRAIDGNDPAYVVIENTPDLLSKWRAVVDADLTGRGFHVSWVKIAAAHIGAPHLRRRVFIVARRDKPPGSRIVDAGPVPPPHHLRLDTSPRWPPDIGQRRAMPGAACAIRVPRNPRRWYTPSASDHKGSNTPEQRRRQLSAQVEPGTGGRLNPDWCELLMGLPPGWTDVRAATADPYATAGAWPALPGLPAHAFEPPRTVRNTPGRAPRIKAIGNAVCWLQGAAAIRLGMADEPTDLGVSANADAPPIGLPLMHARDSADSNSDGRGM